MTLTQLKQTLEGLINRPMRACRQRGCLPLRIACTLIPGTSQADIEIVHIDPSEITTISHFSVNYTAMSRQDVLSLIETDSVAGRGWHHD